MGNADTDHTARKRLRKRLRAFGYDEPTIEARVDDMRRRQQARRRDTELVTVKARRRASQQAIDPRVEAATYARFALDDTRHKPRSTDPLLTGPARATGPAARAVKRGKTLTRTEWLETSERQHAS